MTPLPSSAPHGATRRTFLAGAAAATGVGVLAACGPGEPSPTASPEPAREDGALAEVADVPVGGSLLVTASSGAKVLVAQPEEGTVVAFSAVCTHMGCTVMPDGAELHCPCHGSVYDLASGDNVAGPAPRPLDQIPVEVRDGLVVEA